MQATQTENGAVLVEFALVLLPLSLLVFGFLQFGIAMNAKIDATHLTAEAARYTVVNQNPGAKASPVQTLPEYIRSRADTADLKENAVVCIEYPVNPETATSGKVGDPVRVTLEYSYLDLVPLVGDRLDPPATSLAVTSEATMRLEALPKDIAAGCTPAPTP